MLGQYGFLSEIFSLFASNKVSVDVVASSDVSVSLTLDQKQKEKEDLPELLEKLNKIADVRVLDGRAIISLISNLERSSEVMAKTFSVCSKLGINIEMLSQGASKVNISLIVQMKDKDRLIKALHACFFENVSINDLIPDALS